MVLPLSRLHGVRGERKALWRECDTVPEVGDISAARLHRPPLSDSRIYGTKESRKARSAELRNYGIMDRRIDGITEISFCGEYLQPTVEGWYKHRG